MLYLSLPLLLLAASAHAEVKKLSFVLTNDVHGHLEPAKLKNGATAGGLGYLASYVRHLRGQTEYYNRTSGLFVVDSGDQFQGTLISNFDEGKAIFEAFNQIGYDAVIPGNHDYDFGPLNWLEDRVVPGVTSDNPREVIEGLSKIAAFPLLSANTFYKASIRANTATPVKLNSSCEPVDQTLLEPLDFSQAKRPDFLKPYVIIEKAGVRVAFIGIDNKQTASTTTPENVSDLCFRDEAESYIELRRQLEGQADVFVILMHNGNASNSKDATNITTKINTAIPNGVDLVAAGHTHAIHDNVVDGVHIIQDGANAKAFGRVDLYYDVEAKKVLRDQTQSWAAQNLDPTRCKADNRGRNAFVCDDYPLPIPQHAGVDAIIQRLRTDIAPLATKHVMTAAENITRDRVSESPMSNLLTDALRTATGADIAFMNTGGIRVDLDAGDINYEGFFEVLPFANKVAVIDQLPWATIQKLLQKSVITCGRYGGLMFSGLKVQYSRTCASDADMDNNGKLLRVETLDGRLLLDAEKNFRVPLWTMFKVATLDFIAAGGSGYEEFVGVKVDRYAGIARDVIAGQLAKSDTPVTNTTDGRFKNIAPSTASAERATIHNPKPRKSRN